ncbi:MAG TPA: hypothetical protein ENN28_02585 [Candidatus Uhrbacteria bacterium]|nr:hypothetical protein [Candidatus Uhrbacteria bacterium]
MKKKIALPQLIKPFVYTNKGLCIDIFIYLGYTEISDLGRRWDKMVTMVPLLTEEKKALLFSKIQKLSENFSDESFEKLMLEIAPLDSANLELWLKDLREDLPLAYGILALLYYSRGEYILAFWEAVMVKNFFPDNEMWKNLILHLIVDGALNGSLSTE